MRITVYGAGGWGTALTCLLHRNGHQLSLWSWEQKDVERLNADRENKLFLPGVKIAEDILISSDYALGQDAELVVLAVPSHAIANVAKAAAPYIAKDAIIVNVAKGFFPDNGQRLSEVIREILPNHPVVTLSGPSHAEDAGRNLLTAVVVAGGETKILEKVQDTFMNNNFRVYPNTDQIGVEVGGAVKNIIALGSGMLDGLEQGDNAKAALMTRGLAEITRLGVAMGADPMTFAGLAGVGDLIVTCTSIHSRNFRAGREIGRGKPWREVLAESAMVVEGVNATAAAYQLAKKYQVEMPITEQMYKILYEDLPPKEAMYLLMTRAKTYE